MITFQSHILIVDPDDHWRGMVCRTLDTHRISEAITSVEAQQILRSEAPDILLTSIQNPQGNGIALMHEALRLSPLTAVILVTSEPTLETALEAIQAGAAGYLMKPCSAEELRGTVYSALRRTRPIRAAQRLMNVIREEALELVAAEADPAPQRVQRLGSVEIYHQRFQIGANGRMLDLTPTEMDLLTILLENRSRIVTCVKLVEAVRGYQASEDEAREVIRPHISNLRRKLKQLGLGEQTILNVRGIGYRLSDKL